MSTEADLPRGDDTEPSAQEAAEPEAPVPPLAEPEVDLPAVVSLMPSRVELRPPPPAVRPDLPPLPDATTPSTIPVVIPGSVPEPKRIPISDDSIFTGELLRQIRESQKITLKEISQRTRISVASLAALETEKYEDLPNARVYVRGFVRCLAVEIGLDKDQVSRSYLPRWERWFASQEGARAGR